LAVAPETTAPSERLRLVRRNTLLLEVGGFTILAVTSLGLLTLPVILLVPLRETTPGSWPVAASSTPPAG
jgi:hypothetical protein